MRKGAFLDRDGVINVDSGYVHTWDRWQWVDGAQLAIEYLAASGYEIFVVTNQSGIGRQMYTDREFRALSRQAFESLPVRQVLYCPHLPSAGCPCRKPSPTLIHRAVREFRLDRRQSFLIGDKDSDLECAANAGIEGWKFEGGNLLRFTEDRLSTFRKSF